MGIIARNFKTSNGQFLQETYHVINKISINNELEEYSEEYDDKILIKFKPQTNCIAVISVFPDKQAYMSNVQPIELYVVTINLNSIKSFQEIYLSTYNQVSEYLYTQQDSIEIAMD